MTNSEARKLLSDFSVIGRDLLSKTAAKAAEAMAPEEEALRRVDESAPSDQFITEGGRPTDTSETPVLQGQIPGTNATVSRHPEDDQTRIRTEDTERGLGTEAKTRARETAEEGKAEVRQHAEDIRSSEAPAQEAKAKKSGLMGRMKEATVRHCIFSFQISR